MGRVIRYINISQTGPPLRKYQLVIFKVLENVHSMFKFDSNAERYICGKGTLLTTNKITRTIQCQ